MELKTHIFVLSIHDLMILWLKFMAFMKSISRWYLIFPKIFATLGKKLK